MPRAKNSARSRASQAKRNKQLDARYKRNVAKLEKAGLVDKVNHRVKRDAKAQRAIVKYADFLNGKYTAVKTDKKTAREVSTKFGFAKRGNTVLVPRQKHERVSINKKGEVISKRPNPRDKKQTITRKIGAPLAPPKKGQQLYYTIRERKRGLGKIHRTTFAKFDDLLEYLAAYEINWDDVEPYFETEYVNKGKAEQLDEKIAEERRAGHERWRRRKARASGTKVRRRKKRR